MALSIIIHLNTTIMKNKMILTTFISLNLLLFSNSCDKIPLEQTLGKCNLNGDLITIEDKLVN